MTNAPLRIAAMLSGGGRTLLNLLDEIDAGRLAAEVVTVISSRSTAAGVERARDRGLDVHVVAERDDDAVSALLARAEPDLVCLCGYLRLLRIDPWMVGRVVNIHPSLLPAHGGRGMYGDRVHAAVLEAGDAETGCTVHFVDEEYDHGPTVLQRRCPVEDGDDVDRLAGRVFAEECIAYPEAIRRIADGRVRFKDGRIITA